MANETSTVNFVFTSTDKTKNILGGITKGFVALGAAAATAAVAGVAGLGAFAASGVKAAASMEEQMSNIAAVMGTTKSDIEPLSDLIKDLGLDPNLKVDATEAASAIELLARNGLDMEQILNGAARSTVLLANATGAEFGDAADIATDAMSIFNISADDMMSAVDGIVSVTTNSKLSINDYALAMANGAARADAAGVSFDDFNTTIALIADEAGNGQKAGTALGAMMTRLVPQTNKAAEAMTDFGIITESGQNQFFDAQGNFLGMGNAADVLSASLGGLSEQQQLAAVTTLFGVDASAAAIGVMNESSETFAAAQAQMGDTSAVDSAAERMDNLAGQWEIFMGIVDTVKLQVGEAFLPVLKNLTSLLSELAEDNGPKIVAMFQNFTTWVQPVIEAFLNMIPLLSDATLLFEDGSGALMEFFVALGFGEEATQKFLENAFLFIQWAKEATTTVSTFVSGALESLRQWLDDTQAIEKAQALFNKFREWFVETLPIVVDFVRDALNKIKNWFDEQRPNINNFIENVLKPFLAIIVDIATRIKDFVLKQFEKISAWYLENEELIKNFAKVMGTVWAAAMVAVTTFWKVVEPILDTLINLILRVAKIVMAIATGDWKTAWEAYLGITEIVVEGIKNVFLGLADWVTGFFGTTWAAVMGVWEDNLNQFLNIGTLVARNIARGVANTASEITEAAKRLAGNLRDGWKNGMTAIKSQIISAALAPFNGAISAVKALLGIRSPSKLFEELGVNTGQGFAIGLSGQTANVAAAGAQMGQAAIAGTSSTTTNYNLNVATAADTSNVIQDFQMMQAWAG